MKKKITYMALIVLTFMLCINVNALTSVKVNTYEEGQDIEIEEPTYDYKITYVLKGGINNINNPVGYNRKTATIKLKSPKAAGYTFKGWYKDKKYKNKVTSITSKNKGNITLYAKWSVNTYNIKFNGNGATSGKMNKVTNRKYNKTYSLPANKFKRKGYTFVGWNTKKDGSGTMYTNKSKIKGLTATNKKTVTLYAIWKINNYKIVYNLGGGNNNINNPATYTIKQTVQLANASADNYYFLGWYSDSKFKKRVTTIKKGSTGTKKLYAKWQKKIIFRGTGSKVITGVNIPSGNYKVIFDSSIEREQHIDLSYYKNGYKTTDIFTRSFIYDKSYHGEVCAKGLCEAYAVKNGTLTINSQGTWTIEFAPIALFKKVGRTITGTGDVVTGMFTGDGKKKTFYFTNDGESNFIVWIHDSKTWYKSKLLVNKIDYSSGKATFTPRKGVKYFFSIKSYGNWTIKY